MHCMEKGQWSKKKDINILIALILAIFILNYPILDDKLENFLNTPKQIHVDRIIDGDTIESNKTSIRLLGINTPERGEIYYLEAKSFLEQEILNETVNLKFGRDKYDKYNRTLAYFFLDNKNINIELIKNGLANYYFPAGKDQYYQEFKNVWKECLSKNVNLCEASINKCARCVSVKDLDIKNNVVVLHNSCGFSCDLTGWKIKDEGRKNFVFSSFILNSGSDIKIRVRNGTDTNDTLFWKGETYVWTKTGDSLFLRDKEEKLVLWTSY